MSAARVLEGMPHRWWIGTGWPLQPVAAVLGGAIGLGLHASRLG